MDYFTSDTSCQPFNLYRCMPVNLISPKHISIAYFYKSPYWYTCVTFFFPQGFEVRVSSHLTTNRCTWEACRETIAVAIPWLWSVVKPATCSWPHSSQFWLERCELCITPLCNIFQRVAFRKVKIKTPWSESASELYRLSDRRLSTKWLPTFADRGCRVVSVTDPYCRILGFLDRSRYFSIK
jgi:hypothetical protein